MSNVRTVKMASLTPYQDRTALIGVYTALSIVFGIAENFIALPVPGLRLGLANVGIMLAIISLDVKAAFTVAFLKAIIVPLVTGNFIVKISLGLPATLMSTFLMLTYYKLCARFITSISMGALGGLVHIVTQFTVASFLYIKSPALYGLLPYFSVFSIACGSMTGYIAMRIRDYLNLLDNGAGVDGSKNNSCQRLAEASGADDPSGS